MATLLAASLASVWTGCSSPAIDPVQAGAGAGATTAGAGSGGAMAGTAGTLAQSAGNGGTAGVAAGSGGATSSGTAGAFFGGGGAGAASGGGGAGSGSAGESAGSAGVSTPGGGGAGGAGAGGGGIGGAEGGAGGGLGGAAGGGATGGGQGGTGVGGAPMHRELILYNDVPGELLYVNHGTPAMNWRVSSGAGRDMQLVGSGRVMLGKSTGWDEYQLGDGARVARVTNLSGTQSTHRLADGTTMVASISNGSILLRMANATGAVQSQVTYAGYSYVRCVRPTAGGNFLVTADTKVFEGTPAGQVVWEVTLPGSGQHVWKAMRLANGNTAVATGYDQSLNIYDANEQLVQTITAPSSVYPEFFADFHVTPGGNYFVVNSQADRTEDRSIQLLEFSPAGQLVWQEKQPEGVTSLEAAIVLDGLDTTKLHVEPQGVLVPVP